MAEDSKIKVDKFDGSDYGFWKMQIEDLLYQKSLHLPMFGEQPDDMYDEEWKLLDRQALGVVRLSLAKSVAYNIVNETTTSNSKRRGQSKNRKDIECWNCKEKGHFRNQCPKPKAEKKEVNNVYSEESRDFLICCVENSEEESWIMDSGASFHDVSCPDMVKNLQSGNLGKVSLADDQVLDITDLRRKLISVDKLDDEGFNVHFGGGQWKVIKGNLVIAKGKKKGSLYMVEIHGDGVHAVTAHPSPSNLWHQRLGHMSDKGLKMLAQKGKFPDLKKVETEFCESCVLGKQKRTTFVKTGKTPKAQKLELVHSDVFGPTPVSSLGGKNYYVTFIDDSTRKVKCLKSDNGGEYISKEFVNYCAKHGIKMIKTVPGTPKQNGVAERMNRTLNEKARSMRLNAGIPKILWADAVNTAAYLINRSPCVPLDFKLPEEMWQGKEVSLKHLKVFGCSAYSLLKDGDRDKLDSKTKKCIFIGYGSEEMGYRLWDSENRKLIRSKNVTFNEAELYKDRNNKTLEAEKKYVEFEGTEKKKEASVEIPGDDSTDSGSSGDNSRNDSEDEETIPPSPESPVTPQVQLRRSSRVGEPECYFEAMKLKDSLQWELAMKDEMKSLEKNKTWLLTKLPSGKKAL
nr:retrovirus-related Pol polyprotein from transposon TNT 1-94 [Tanacetum cinerariifolium]